MLVAAYDDAAGVTAAFNKNVLSVVDRELGADFDLDAFEHVALWDAGHEWIEMRLRSRVAQTVKIPALGLAVDFAEGEEMRTEISAKFREEGVRAELAERGLRADALVDGRGGPLRPVAECRPVARPRCRPGVSAGRRRAVEGRTGRGPARPRPALGVSADSTRVMRSDALRASVAGSAPPRILVMHALIGLSASTAAHWGEDGVARPCAAPAAMAATPGSPETAPASEVLLGT